MNRLLAFLELLSETELSSVLLTANTLDFNSVIKENTQAANFEFIILIVFFKNIQNRYPLVVLMLTIVILFVDPFVTAICEAVARYRLNLLIVLITQNCPALMQPESS